MKINGMTRERGIIKQGLRLLNILIFLWSFWCEKTIFYVGMITETRRLVMYILIKLMLISLLVIENRVLMHIIDTFREKETKFCCCFFGLLVAAYSLFFCLIYPGVT